MLESQTFLNETGGLKRLVQLTKDINSNYIGKRCISAEYALTGAYDFASWQQHLDSEIRSAYKRMHTTLLYTDEKQAFDVALKTFEKSSTRLTEIGE